MKQRLELCEVKFKEKHLQIQEYKDEVGVITNKLLACQNEDRENKNKLLACQNEVRENKKKIIYSEDIISTLMQHMNILSEANPSYTWTIRDYGSLSDYRLDSPPFYTSLHGYHCQLNIAWFGKHRGRLGMYIDFIPGNNDDILIWPFNMKVKFECCDKYGFNHIDFVCPEEVDNVNLWMISMQ